MRALDTRVWNLIPPALLLMAACTTRASTPVDETGDSESTTDESTGDGDENGDDADTNSTGNDDPTGDGECNPPCGAHQFCVEGEYCYTIPPDPECFEDLDCGPGEYCENYQDEWEAECSPLDPLPECDAPELIEIPLPDAAQGMILDLEFADLDAAGSDELLLLRPGELLVVRSDQSVASYEVNPLAEELAVVHANDDEMRDVVLTSSTPDAAQLLLGNGDGTLATPTTLPLPGLVQPRTIDWVPGGAEDLVAIDNVRTVTRVSDLAGLVSAMPVYSFGTDVDAIHVVLSGQAAVAVRRDCFVRFYDRDDLGEIGETDFNGTDFDQQCESEHESYDPLFVMVTSVGANTSLRTSYGFGTEAGDVVIPGSVGDIAHVAGLGVVSAGPAMTRLLIPEQKSYSCVANLDSLPIATGVVAGDFADNPGEEFLLLGQDQLSAWARP